MFVIVIDSLIFQIGYTVVRSLSDYRLGSRHLLNLPGDRDLKVSIGTGDSNGPATTWHVVTSSSSSQKKSGKPDFREDMILDASKQLNNKIYFLATGNGCSTLQVNYSAICKTACIVIVSNASLSVSISFVNSLKSICPKWNPLCIRSKAKRSLGGFW
jgi:hypothetical protein